MVIKKLTNIRTKNQESKRKQPRENRVCMLKVSHWYRLAYKHQNLAGQCPWDRAVVPAVATESNIARVAKS